MNLARCEKGHFYDQDKHGVLCPYCAQMAKSAPEPTISSAPAFPEQIPEPERPSSQPPAGNSDVSPADKTSCLREDPPSAPFSSPVSFNPDHQEDNCTVGYYSRVIGVEPVVGWLVCIEGEYRGESFKLKSGRNFIGRAANMDVVLSADHSISRYKHAAIIYDPKSRQFIVTAGEARELCYLNGELVLSNLKMNAYDILNLGATSLMLIPCCGDRFSWEEGLKEKGLKE